MTSITVTGTNLDHDGNPPQDETVTTTLKTRGVFSSNAGINRNTESHSIDNSTGAWSADLQVPTDGSAVLYAFAFPDGSAYTIPVSSSSSTDWETLKATAGDAETYDPATLDLYMPKAGGTFTGRVTLSGAPTAALHAATKQFVEDTTISAEVNDLTAAVTWDDIPDVNVPETAVTQHEGALTLSNLAGSVTDGQVPNTITLDNITQITTRSHTSLSDIGTNTHSQIDSHITGTGTAVHGLGTIATEAETNYLLAAGTRPLTANWDIGDTFKILADEIRARDGDGLKLHDDGGNGMLVSDGGNVEVSRPGGATITLENKRLTLSSGEQLGGISFVSNDTSGGGAGEMAKVIAYARTGYDQFGNLGLFTRDRIGVGDLDERMTILYNGLTGINQTSPQGQLEIAVNLAATTGLIIQLAAAQTANAFEVQSNGGGALSSIDKLGAWNPPSMADSAANNNSIYYSTTASRLVYKDSSGTVNNLY